MYTLLLATVTITALLFFWRNIVLKRGLYRLLKENDTAGFILNHLSDGVIVLDLQNKITHINRAAELLFGLRADDIVGFKVIAEAKAEPQLATLLEIFFPGKGGALAHTIPKHGDHNDDSQEIIIKKFPEQKLRVFTVPRIDTVSKQQTGLIKIVRDITQDEIINRNKSDLVTIVSHQLRTPLAGIKWIFGSLLDGDYGTLSKEQAEIVSRGTEATDDLVVLIDDMLDVAKIEQSQFTYAFANTELVELVKLLVASKQEVAKTKSITIRERYEELSLVIPIDAKRLRIAFSNIIDNAINYSPANTTVTITLKKDGGNVLVSVADQGIGIPEASRDKLFTKFFRAENAQRLREGTGLGLFLARAIVTGHGGAVSFSSEEGRGSTFTVSVPLTRQ